MRNISVDLTQDSPTPQYLFVGYEGEHNATRLKVVLPERMRLSGEVQYRFLFETARGEAVFSAALTPEEDGSLSVLLAQALMVPPVLKAYVGCYGTENGETVLVAKTPQMLLGVQKSIPETQEEVNVNGACVPGLKIEDRLLKDSENPVESRAIYQELEKKIGKGDVAGSVHAPTLASASSPVSERAVSYALENKVSWSDVVFDLDSSLPSALKVPSETATVSALEKKVGWENTVSSVSSTTASNDKIPTEKAVSHALKEKLSWDNVSTDISASAFSDEKVPSEKAVSVALSRKFDADDLLVYMPSDSLTDTSDPLEQMKKAVSAYGLGRHFSQYVQKGNVESSFSATSKNPVQNKVVSANVANALKGTASGTFVHLDDISPLEHEMKVTLSGEEESLANATLKRCGKNLFDPQSLVDCGGVIQEDGAIYFARANSISQTTVFQGDFGTKRLTFSYKVKTAAAGGSSGARFFIYYKDGTYEYVGNVSGLDYQEIVVTTRIGYQFDRIVGDYGSALNSTWIKDIQIEVGTTKTDYEAYFCTEYELNADGTVDGVKSLYPVTVLSTDSTGVNVKAEYNKDTNKVMENLVNAIISLGGNV